MTAVTIFSGLGSSSKALRDLGHDVVPHDFMPEAVASLRGNDFDLARQVDVREVDFTRYRRATALVGGPPCQPFSQGGRNLGRNDSKDMLPEFVRAVREARPGVFVMENVRGLAGPRHRPYLEEILQIGNTCPNPILKALLRANLEGSM